MDGSNDLENNLALNFNRVSLSKPQFSPEPVVTCVNEAAGLNIRPQLRVLYLVEAEAAVQQQDQPLYSALY